MSQSEGEARREIFIEMKVLSICGGMDDWAAEQ